jgi:anaerobic selenocysteine-containing dehydrogenase
MTNHWVDMINADVVLIMGGNPAEDHPIAMNWLTRTKERGAYILHVDPRFNRTSSIADVFAKLRSGTDIAFVGGMIKYAIDHNRIQQEYVREYTNASWIVGDGYGFEDGLFAGFDPGKRAYDRSRWAFALDAQGQPQRDPTLEHPRCVFQLLKQHFSRYNAEAVCRITGTPKEHYLRVCDLYTSTFAPDRAGTWLYAMGTAQLQPRHAEHPLIRHPAASARQHRRRRRRCQRHAGRVQRPGFHRSGTELRWLARIPAASRRG